MATTINTTSPALRVLLERVLDYAGLFPPAGLPLDAVVANYNKYQASEYSWMLRFLVVPASALSNLSKALDGSLSVLSEGEEQRAAALETKNIVSVQRPVYCEVPTNDSNRLDAVKAAGCFAKIRTGGLKAEAIPSASEVASFILNCAQRRLPFKATAGLHHPIRDSYPLTYAQDAPKATMHGFLNILLAAAFAWHGETDLEPLLAETDAATFNFDARAHWREKSLSIEEIRDARRDFIHSVGSCSFDEPVDELKMLGLL